MEDGEEKARLIDPAHCYGDSQCPCNYLCNRCFPDEILSYIGTGLLDYYVFCHFVFPRPFNL